MTEKEPPIQGQDGLMSREYQIFDRRRYIAAQELRNRRDPAWAARQRTPDETRELEAAEEVVATAQAAFDVEQRRLARAGELTGHGWDGGGIAVTAGAFVTPDGPYLEAADAHRAATGRLARVRQKISDAQMARYERANANAVTAWRKDNPVPPEGD